jgi:hypothetical protein
MSKTWDWIRGEIREVFPVWAFFFLAFGLHAMTVSAVLGEYHTKLEEPYEYLVGSLIMAKVVLLVDAFAKSEWLRHRPLIYASLWNTGLYVVAGFIVRYAERLLTLTHRRHLSFAEANRELLRSMSQPNYWAILVWLIILIFAFCMARELIRWIGSERFMEVFFGRTPRRGQQNRKAS